MKDKELRKLKRVELLDMLIEQGKLIDAQNKEISELKDQVKGMEAELHNYRFSLEQAGSIAEASLKVSAVLEAAQKAAAIYLDNLREKSGVPDRAKDRMAQALDELRDQYLDKSEEVAKTYSRTGDGAEQGKADQRKMEESGPA